jgi:hypothetical protein
MPHTLESVPGAPSLAPVPYEALRSALCVRGDYFAVTTSWVVSHIGASRDTNRLGEPAGGMYVNSCCLDACSAQLDRLAYVAHTISGNSD